MTEMTRRNVLTGVAVTAATAVGSAEAAAAPAAPAPAAIDPADVQRFVDLSSALTGIDAAKLAPGVDPIQVKSDYYKQVMNHPDFNPLMDIIRADPKNPAGAADKIMNDPKLKFLGRSIILMWYLGAWYNPTKLMNPFFHMPADNVVSDKAYTQAWVWRVAQTHPMGYSEWHFGYWEKDPPPLDAFIKA
jgi:hypothetical protein